MILRTLRKIFHKTEGSRGACPPEDLSARAYFRYAEASRGHRVSKPYLVLSFDCDTPADAMAAERVANRLSHIGVPAVFAVPGTRIEESAGVYTQIARSGFEFLNHGYLDHAAWDEENQRYYSVTWYHAMTEDKVREDIRLAHACLRSRLGINALGFRAPHFGSFQSEAQLDIIYSEIGRMGYSHATTTMPAAGLMKGAVFPASYGIREFPVTGTYDRPEMILDSWQFLAAPDRIYDGTEYVSQFRKMIDFFAERTLPCILNFYTDPSHVVDFPGFFEAVEYGLKKGMEGATYTQILAETTMSITRTAEA